MKTLDYCAVVLWQQDGDKKHQKKISFLKVKAGLCSHLPHYYIAHSIKQSISQGIYELHTQFCTRLDAAVYFLGNKRPEEWEAQTGKFPPTRVPVQSEH